MAKLIFSIVFGGAQKRNVVEIARVIHRIKAIHPDLNNMFEY